MSRWKDEAEEDITGTGIKILNLDHRTVDALKRAGMITVEEVLALENRKALLRIRNIGASSSEKILDALSAQGYPAPWGLQGAYLREALNGPLQELFENF